MAEHGEDKHAEKGHGGGSHGGHGGHGGGGGGHGEEHEGAPEWLISFADNVALLMGFFVILLAMNMKEPTSGGLGGKDKFGPASGENERMLDLVIGLREAFNNPIDLDSSNPNEAPLIRRIIQRREGTAVEDGPRGDKQNVESVRPTDYRRVGGLVTFDENGSEVDQQGRDAAVAVAKEIKGRRSIVEVRGHVSLAEAYRPLDKGMKLSFDRAMAVAQVLWDAGVERDQVRVVAVGTGDRATPVARDATQRRNNQRAEIIITDETMPADPFAADPSARGAAASQAPASAPAPDAKPTAKPAKSGGADHR